MLGMKEPAPTHGVSKKFQVFSYGWIIIHSASVDASADLSAVMPENRLIKLKIILKHSRML